METDVLRWFQMVGDGATVTEVGEVFMVSQPQVSRSLASLQQEVGAQLLVRSGRVLRLTHAGTVFKRHVDRLIDELDDGYAAVDQLVDPDRGTVTLGYEPSLGSWLVPTLVVGFQAAHPQVRFVLRHLGEDLAEAVDAVAGARIDLALAVSRPPGQHVRWQRLFTEPLFLAVPRGHRFAGRSELALAEAAEERFVLLGDTGLGRLVRQACETAGFDPRIAIDAEDLPTARGFVAAGLGVAIVPATGDPDPNRADTGALTLVPISEPDLGRELGLVWSTQRRLLPSAELFRAYVLRQASQGLPVDR